MDACNELDGENPQNLSSCVIPNRVPVFNPLHEQAVVGDGEDKQSRHGR